MLQSNSYPNDAVAVTPSDTAQLAKAACGFLVAVAGTVTVVTLGGNTTQFTAVVGNPIMIGFTQVKATGTAATGITALLP